MKPLSQIYKELGIAFTFPIEIKDANGKKTYFEGSNGDLYVYEYDANGKPTYFKNSFDAWAKWERDAEGNQTYYEDSKGIKRGTPNKTPSKCYNGAVLEIDGKKYELKLKAQ